MILESQLSSTIKMTAVAIALHVDNKTGHGYASQPRLAQITSCSIRSVHTATGALEGLGLVELKRSMGRGSAHEYQLTLPDSWPAERPEDRDERMALIDSLTPGMSATRSDIHVGNTFRDEGKSETDDKMSETDDTKSEAVAALLLSTSTGTTSYGSAETTTPSVDEKSGTTDQSPDATQPSDDEPTISDAWDALKLTLEGMVEDEEPSGTVHKAYYQALALVDEMAPVLEGLSNNPVSYLKNNVLGHAAQYYFEGAIPGRSFAALNKAAKQLGAQGHHWLIQSLAFTCTKDFEGKNPTPYVIKTAQNKKAEANS